jgi:hypothetical protein
MSDVRSHDEMIAEAAALDCNYVLPKSNELFVDIDSDDALKVFEANFPLFEKLHPVTGLRKTPSKTPGHFHIIVTLKADLPSAGGNQRYQDESRIYWQLLLGSDPMREMLALHHLREGHPPTVFFEPKPKAKTAAKKQSLKSIR